VLEFRGSSKHGNEQLGHLRGRWSNTSIAFWGVGTCLNSYYLIDGIILGYRYIVGILSGLSGLSGCYRDIVGICGLSDIIGIPSGYYRDLWSIGYYRDIIGILSNRVYFDFTSSSLRFHFDVTSIELCSQSVRLSVSHVPHETATNEPNEPDIYIYIYIYIYFPNSVLTDGVLAAFLKDQ
jgi:hypothetical protein